MRKTLIIIAAMLAAACSPKNEKQVYIPKDLQEMDLSDTSSLWCYERSAENDDLVFFWQKGFGPDLATAPDYLGHNMKVDLPNLMERAQYFYDFFKNDLGFIQPGSKADIYKMMVMLMYSDEGTAYGGDYDETIGGLWVTPLRTYEKNLNVIAHELGHSFQSQLSLDTDSGFGGGGIYEMTSQWMLWNANEDWMTSENYHWQAFMDQTQFAFMHPDNMYRSPYVLEYWSDKHGLKFIGDLWRAAKHRHDVIQVYEEFTGIDDYQFGQEMYEYAAKSMTYDFDRVREIAAPYANQHRGKLEAADAQGWRRISQGQEPQQYGYNGIALDVPAPGTKISVNLRGEMPYLGPMKRMVNSYEIPEEVDGSVGAEMTDSEDKPNLPKADVPTREEALESASSEAAWTFGLAGVKADGTPIYSESQSVVYEGMGWQNPLEFTVPSDEPLAHLWLVVVATPHHHVDVLEWNNDYLLYFPYTIHIE